MDTCQAKTKYTCGACGPTEYEATPTVALRNVAITRWCVDSGANRDICNERHLFNGNMTEKHIRIGEAGAGHSFTSEAEGAIPLRVRGKMLPLFERAIYADSVSENIMSVPEAVDRGYTVVFTKTGVEFHEAEKVRVPAEPILKGARTPATDYSMSPSRAHRLAL